MHPALESALDQNDGVLLPGDRAESLVGRGALQQAVSLGEVLRVRRGVYAHAAVDREIVRASRVGGVLAGHSACRLLGLWRLPAPEGDALVVSVPATTGRLRDPDDPSRPLARRSGRVRVLHDAQRLDPQRERLVVGVATCVTQVIRMHSPELGLAVLDSSLRLPEHRRPLLNDLRKRLPARCSRVLALADARAESGTESILRWRLTEAGIPFVIQESLSPSIRVDFVVAGRLVVECTSFEYHASPQQYRLDRDRIAAVVRLGFGVLELAYHQVLFGWDEVLETIEAALAFATA